MHLRRERLQRREALLLAQLRREFDLDLAPVEIGLKIEQVRLEQRFDTTDRRPGAETRNARERLPGHPMDVNREDPRDRCTPPLEGQVGGRKSQVPAQALATD